MMKKIILVLAMVVLGLFVVSGCSFDNDKTQYLVTKDNAGILRPIAKVSYNVFRDGRVTAKIVSYRRCYSKPSVDFPGHMDFDDKKSSAVLEKLKNCIVFDTSNWEGDLQLFSDQFAGLLHVKVVNGQSIEPTDASVSFFQWYNEVKFSGHEWVAGTKHPTKQHIVASTAEGRWFPEEGYEWVREKGYEWTGDPDEDGKHMIRDKDGWPKVKKIGDLEEK